MQQRSDCVCRDFGCGEPTCNQRSPSEPHDGWYVRGNGDVCGMQLDCCVDRASLSSHCEVLEERERYAASPRPRPQVQAAPPQSIADERDEYEIDWPLARPNRERTTCATMGADTPTPALVGMRINGMYRDPPPGLDVRGTWALGTSFGVAEARRGSTLVAIITRSQDETSTEVVTSAFEITSPCPNLMLVAVTCVVDGRHDERVFALMSADYVCGGHGESSPARAWRVVDGVQRALDPEGVTCGSISCEVDPSP